MACHQLQIIYSLNYYELTLQCRLLQLSLSARSYTHCIFDKVFEGIHFDNKKQTLVDIFAE